MRKTLIPGLLLISLCGSTSTVRADWGDTDKINKNWDAINKKVKDNDEYWKKRPGEMQKSGEFQKAGTIQTPGTFRTVKEFRAALKAGKVIKSEGAPCHKRFVVGADTLFEFDKATLTPYAEETLKTLGPMIAKLGAHPVKIEGHTDSVGSDDYNQKLSEKRAERVRNWLVQNHFAPTVSEMVGYGELRPKVRNTTVDGKDDPIGRAQNRRVEIVVDTCSPLKAASGSAE